MSPLYPWYVPYNAECKVKRYQVPFLKNDPIWDWTQVSQTIGEHFTHLANEPVHPIIIHILDNYILDQSYILEHQLLIEES